MNLKTNLDYYAKLNAYVGHTEPGAEDQKYPNPEFEQINLDVLRTPPPENSPLPEDELKQKHQIHLQKLTRILESFVKRSPTVGYCQGMNFLAS